MEGGCELDHGHIGGSGRSMYWDEVTCELVYDVMRPPKLDLEYFNEMQMYEQLLIEEARHWGHQVFGVHWVAAKKADRAHRSTLVAQEIKLYNAPELFPATHPTGSLKYLLRTSAQDVCVSIMHVHVTRALFLRRGDQ